MKSQTFFQGDIKKLEDDHIWLRVLGDLQSVKEEFEGSIEHLSNLKIWAGHEGLKERMISKLGIGQKHLIFVVYCMYLAIDKSPQTAFKYMKWIKDENFSLANFDDVVDKFDQIYESKVDEDFTNIILDGWEDVNLPLTLLLPSKEVEQGLSDHEDDFDADPLESLEEDHEIKDEPYVDEETNSEPEYLPPEFGQNDISNGTPPPERKLRKRKVGEEDKKSSSAKKIVKKNDRLKRKVKKDSLEDSFGRKVGKRTFYDCTCCQETFTMKRQLFQHYSTVHKREMHTCSSCNVVFEDSHDCNLLPSITTEIANPLEEPGSTPQACQYCGQTFPTDDDLADHLVCHEDEDHVCITCGKKYPDKETLERHFKYHQKVKRVRHKCNLCMKIFWDKESVLTHIREHKGEKPFICDECGKAFKDRKIFKKHVKVHIHGIIKKYKCDACPKAFRYEKDLMKHLRSHNDQPHICTICGRKLPTEAGLNKHMFYHTGQAKTPIRKKPTERFPCEECGTTYSTKSLLKYHMRLHTGDSPFICKVCGKICQTQQSYNSHQQIHDKETTYQCDVCEKTFTHVGSLRSHMDIHTDETFPCQICGQVFDRRIKLYKHRSRKHKDRFNIDAS